MNQRIDWPWFVISQIAFGIVAGIVVSRQERIATWQPFPWPFAKAWRRKEPSTRKTERTRGDEDIPRLFVAVAILPVLMGVACSNSRGRPGPNSEVLPPDARSRTSISCTRRIVPACHGPEGKDGAAIPLGDPLFLAIADDAVIRRIATTGVPGTPMPAFATERGRNAHRQTDRCSS